MGVIVTETQTESVQFVKATSRKRVKRSSVAVSSMTQGLKSSAENEIDIGVRNRISDIK